MLASPPPRAPPRASQVLPTVKCSNCNQPVPLNELGDHVCAAAPPVPRLPTAQPPPTNSPPSPKSRAEPPKELSISPRRPFANANANPRGSNASFQTRSSPLGHSFEESNEDYFARQAAANSRDTMTSFSSGGTARPSFISLGGSDTQSIKSVAASAATSPLSARLPPSSQRNQNIRSPRIPEQNMSPVSPLAALTNALVASSSAPTLGRPSFSSVSSSQSIEGMSRGPIPNEAIPSGSPDTNPNPNRPFMSPSPPSPGPSQGPPNSNPNRPFMLPSPPGHGHFRGPPNPNLRGSLGPNPPTSPGPSPGPSNINLRGVPFMSPIPHSTGPGSPSPSRGPPNPGANLPGPLRAGPFPPGLGPGNPIPMQLLPGSRGPPTPSPAHNINHSMQQQKQPVLEPDTKSGGEAGMAGVGRRGFAAAARAALFTNNVGGGRGPFLDIDAAALQSPGGPLTSPSPVSPPSAGPPSALVPGLAAVNSIGTGPTPESFFDKFRKMPGLGIGPYPDSDTSPVDHTRTQAAAAGNSSSSITPRVKPSRKDSSVSEVSVSSSTTAITVGSGHSTSSASASTSKSARRQTIIRKKSVSGNTSDGSDYGGLAYADSTDDEDMKSRLSVKSGVSRRTTKSRRDSREGATPVPGQRNALRPVSGSVYSDDDDDNDLRHRLQLETSPPPINAHLNRTKSNSSVSTATSATSSSAAIAKALGLSKSSAEGYSVIGGPGAPGVARTPSGKSIIKSRNRSATVSSSKSLRSNASSSGRAMSDTEGRSKSGIGFGSSKTELEQVMEGLLADIGSPPTRPIGIGLRDDGPSPPPVSPPFYDSNSNARGSKLAHRSNTVGVTTPYTSLVDAAEKMPKLPARSKTERASKAIHVGGIGNDSGTKKKIRVCVRCDKRIEDGRWISIDVPGGDGSVGRNGERGDQIDKGVLCERCWKNMYLPKCRRCNLPIEKQAVSSSDGQLKGKYHKDCFNCFTCNEPFPDKVFYVYDGRPLCKYHYHEANESLCAAAKCGQPIEGPCAVSHTGDRYHPEHLICEWSGYPKCDVLLNGEYWELDGSMLCEKHAKRSGENSEDDESDNEERTSGAMKRMTKFIDLGALGDLR